MMTMAPAAPAARLMRLARPSLQAFSSSSKAAQRQPSLARGLSLLSRSSSRSSSASPRAAAASVLRPCKPQTRGLANDVKSKIDGAIKEKPVVLFMKGTPRIPQCGFSRAVCQILEVQGVPMDQVKTYNVLEDQELRDAIKEYSSWPTIPQLYLNGEFIGGCDILLGMHQSGELEDMLVKVGLVPKPTESSSEQAQESK